MKIQLKKIKIFFSRIPWVIVEHLFPCFLFVVFLAFIIGGIVFYRYVFLIEKEKIEILEKPILFNEQTYEGVLEKLNDREKVIQEIDSKEYRNPFNVFPSEVNSNAL